MNAIYFPILPGKHGEIEALGQLYPHAQYRTLPMIDLVRPKEIAKMESHMCGLTQAIARLWGTRLPAYLDLSLYGPEDCTSDGRHIVEHLFTCAAQCQLVAMPVIGPLSTRGPETTYLDAVRRIALTLGRGAAFRLPYFEFSYSERLGTTIDETLHLSGLDDSLVDLYLDAGPLSRLPPSEQSERSLAETFRNAIRALDGRRFRNLVICATNMPERQHVKRGQGPECVPRTELSVWHSLVTNGAHNVGFGDYGIRFPYQANPGGPVNPPGRINVATAHKYLLRSRDPERADSLMSRR